jgi:VanZ family protein
MGKAYLPGLLWLLFVTGLSVMPGVQLPQFRLFSADKLAHAFVYGMLVLLLAYGFRRQRGELPLFRPAGLFFVLFSSGYGALMEWVQWAFIPGRFFELDDMLANALGALLGWAIWRLVQRKGQ